MTARTSPNGLVGLVAITGGFIVGLHQLGAIPGLAVDWSHPVAWLEASRSEEAIGGLLRSAGLVLGYWVLGSAALCVAFGLRKVRRPLWVSLITLRWVRRVADRALVATLTASIVATPIAPAVAESPPAPIVFEAETDGIPVPHVRMDAMSGTDTGSPAEERTTGDAFVIEHRIPPLPAPLSTGPTATPNAASALAQNQHYTVVSGDNLWTIAAHHISDTTAVEPDASKITAYWLELIAANRDTLRSGDPNLIFPGEVLSLPVVEDAP